MRHMRSLVLFLTLMAVPFGAASADTGKDDGQKIIRNGEQASIKGPASCFTGNVRIDPLYPANNAMRSSGGSVTFEPGARSNWHVHPVGQVLIVTAGLGLTQEWGRSDHPARRCGHLSCGGQALARSGSKQFHDPHIHLRGKGTWQGRTMAGASHRRPI